MTKTVGVIGGGQLARMMIPAAVNLDIELRVLAEVEGSSAALAATSVGDYKDIDTVLDFAKGCEVITFDHEHVPQPVLAALLASGVAVRPSPEALKLSQNKIWMRQQLEQLGMPLPVWAAVSRAAELNEFIAARGGRAVVKTATGGYDGKGVRFVTDAEQVADWFAELGQGEQLLAEEAVPFVRELSQLSARNPSGDFAAWPLVETLQQNGVCTEVYAPAPGASPTLQRQAQSIARTIAEGLGITGVLAVELFERNDGKLLINELALRPHNSGHWTIEGSITSQFEQHLRAVLDLPLGETGLRESVAVMLNILGGPQGGIPSAYQALLQDGEVKLHSYGKNHREGRKVGHITMLGKSLDQTLSRLRKALESIQ